MKGNVSIDNQFNGLILINGILDKFGRTAVLLH